MTATRLIVASTLVLALTACSGGNDPATGTDEAAAADTINDAVEASAGDMMDDGSTDETGNDDADADEEAVGLPGMDIYLAGLSWVDGVPSIGTPRNVTNQPGYDNQPAFVPGSHDFYYSAESEAGTTDVYRFNSADGTRVQVTNTPEDGEYSPRLLSDGQSIAFLHQDAAGTQLITRSDLDGGNREVMIDLHPVGYFAFSPDERQAAMFVLTEPFSLQVADLDAGTVETVYENIDRALYATPDGTGAIFTTPREDGGFQAMHYGFIDGETAYLFDLPGLSQDYALASAPDGLAGAFASDDGMLVWRDANSADWTPVGDLSAFGLTGITRMAVSDDAAVIAIVAAE